MKKVKTIVINLYGGPGTGKSTTAAGIFHNLKLANFNVEVASEWIKEKVWADLGNVGKNQLYVFAKQHNRIWILNGKVEYIITDSPLALSYHYGKVSGEPDEFFQLVYKKIQYFNNIHIFLNRTKEYNSSGRFQNEIQAKKIDEDLKRILLTMIQGPIFQIDSDENTAKAISSEILNMKKRGNDLSDFLFPLLIR
jgi:adenylate kinase family enzyme